MYYVIKYPKGTNLKIADAGVGTVMGQYDDLKLAYIHQAHLQGSYKDDTILVVKKIMMRVTLEEAAA